MNDRDRRAERGDKAICCYTAPSVVAFNQTGDVVKAWGGPKAALCYDWPENEHGMFVDYKGNVWLGGNGENDGMVLKFSNDGKFLMSIGKSAKQTNSLDQTRVGRAAYEAFPAAEARRLVERFEWHYAPKHGSRFDMAKSELGVLASQCLNRRIADKQILAHEVNA